MVRRKTESDGEKEEKTEEVPSDEAMEKGNGIYINIQGYWFY